MEGEAGAMDDERYAEQDVDRTFEEEDDAAFEDNLKETMLVQHEIEADAGASSGDEDPDVPSDEDPELEEEEGQMLEEEGVAYRSLLSLDLRNNGLPSPKDN